MIALPWVAFVWIIMEQCCSEYIFAHDFWVSAMRLAVWMWFLFGRMQAILLVVRGHLQEWLLKIGRSRRTKISQPILAPPHNQLSMLQCVVLVSMLQCKWGASMNYAGWYWYVVNIHIGSTKLWMLCSLRFKTKVVCLFQIHSIWYVFRYNICLGAY